MKNSKNETFYEKWKIWTSSPLQPACTPRSSPRQLLAGRRQPQNKQGVVRRRWPPHTPHIPPQIRPAARSWRTGILDPHKLFWHTRTREKISKFYKSDLDLEGKKRTSHAVCVGCSAPESSRELAKCPRHCVQQVRQVQQYLRSTHTRVDENPTSKPLSKIFGQI